MMAKQDNGWRAYMPLWWDRLMGSAKVQAMAPAHRWYYIMLLRAQWESPEGRIPDDDDFLAVVSGAGAEWPSAAASIRRCFTHKNSFIWNEFCRSEWMRVRKIYSKNKSNGEKGGRPRKINELRDNPKKPTGFMEKPNGLPKKPTANQPEPDPDPEEEEEEKREPSALSSKPAGFDLTPDRPVQETQTAHGRGETQCIQRLWAKYIAATGRNEKLVTLTKLRKHKGLARLTECRRKTGGDLDRAEALMELAIERLAASDWHMGRDAKTGGKRYCEWELHLFPNAEKLEWWLADEREMKAVGA